MSNIRREWTAEELREEIEHHDDNGRWSPKGLLEFLAEATRVWAAEQREAGMVENWRKTLNDPNFSWKKESDK